MILKLARDVFPNLDIGGIIDSIVGATLSKIELHSIGLEMIMKKDLF